MTEPTSLQRIRVVLVETSHPGNIGASARAMKTMGLTRLYLVKPKAFPDQRANVMSSNAEDILAHAVVCDTLAEAVQECHMVIGASARQRKVSWQMLSPREMGDAIANTTQEIALVFGREQSGLSNEELQQCTHHVNIPANPEYSSLNLAMSVQVLAYESRLSALAEKTKPTPDIELATHEDMQRFFAHLEKTLIELNMLQPRCPRKLMQRMRRIFTKTTLEKEEVQLLRGFLRATTWERKSS